MLGRTFSHHLMVMLCVFAAGGIPAAVRGAPVHLVEEAPVETRKPADAVILVDFGRVAYGNLKLSPPPQWQGRLRVCFGEAFSNHRINRKPPGTVRCAIVEVEVDGKGPLVVAPPANRRNTQQPAAVLTPAQWGVVLPFRWVEIEGWPGDLKPGQAIRQAGFLTAWDDRAAGFQSSDETLDRIWELCRYTIKATSFAGIYVDGDRERIPYEADAYLNQLGQYATDNDLRMARDTFERLLAHPTWPTEWAPHMVFMAHADWMRTADATWLGAHYEALKPKLLLDRVGADGWVHSDPKQQKASDLVDWPVGERDGFEFREVNTVVNAFHLAALGKMVELARALGKEAEAGDFAARYRAGLERFNGTLFMSGEGAYRDGIGSDHASSHASLFPLAFGLVPGGRVPAVTGRLVQRGMACSVYAAQYLLEGLLGNGADEAAVGLILAQGDRSWRHMLESGTTVTWEAWDQRFKPNQDWNHAWGAAPANLLPRFVLGAEPTAAGWKTARIRPCPGGLTEARGQVPTPRGPVMIHWLLRNGSFSLKLEIPPGMAATLELPSANVSARVFMDGKEMAATRMGARLVLEQPVTGGGTFHVDPYP